MQCPLCESEAKIVKRQILEYSVITLLKCSDTKCSYRFISTNSKEQYLDEKQDNNENKEETKNIQNDPIKKPKGIFSFHRRN
jgi:hypothetical protein